MSTPATQSTSLLSENHDRAPHSVGYAISNSMVQLVRAHAGRGPTRAKTEISSGLVVVTLGECLTTLEKSLADRGNEALVRQARAGLHEGMRDEAISIVEAATGRRVIAYLTDQNHDPDIALIAFALDGDAPTDGRADATAAPIPTRGLV